jgi:hypothetical protein
MRRLAPLALALTSIAATLAFWPAGGGSGPMEATLTLGPPVAGWMWNPDWLGGNLSLGSTGGRDGGGSWIDLPTGGDAAGVGAVVRPGINRLAVEKLRAMGITSFRTPMGFESSWYDWECGIDRADGRPAPPTCSDAPLSAAERGTGSADRCGPGTRGCFQVLAADGTVDRAYLAHRYPFGSCEAARLIEAVAGERASLVLSVSPFAETFDPRLRYDGRSEADVAARAAVVADKAARWVRALREACGYRGRLAVEVGNEPWDVGAFDQPEYSRQRAIGEPPPVPRRPKILPFWYEGPDAAGLAGCAGGETCAARAVADYAATALAVVRAVRAVDPEIPVGLDAYEVRSRTADLAREYARRVVLDPAIAASGAPTDVDFLVTHRYPPNPPADATREGSDALYRLLAVAPTSLFADAATEVFKAAAREPDFQAAAVGLTEYAPGLLSAPPAVRHSLAAALTVADVLMGFLDPRGLVGGGVPRPRVFGHVLSLADWQGKCPDEFDSGTGLLRLRTELVRRSPAWADGCPRDGSEDEAAQRVVVPFVRRPEAYPFEAVRVLRDAGATLVDSTLTWKGRAPRIGVGRFARRYQLPRPIAVPAARVVAFRAGDDTYLLVLNRHPKRPLVLTVGGKSGEATRWELAAPGGDLWAHNEDAKSDADAPVRLRGPLAETTTPDDRGRVRLTFAPASVTVVGMR